MTLDTWKFHWMFVLALQLDFKKFYYDFVITIL